MTTATAAANPNLAFIKYWGISEQKYRRGCTFCSILRIQKQGSHAYAIDKKPAISLLKSPQN
jgi:mevalonate pyrophosphate decarboxylase